MRLVSFDGGFGRLEGASVVPMGDDIVAWLGGAPVRERRAVPARSLRLSAPVTRPSKVIGVGLNYRDHAAEVSKPLPEQPIFFAKFANSIVASGAEVPLLRVSDQVDFEAELAVVIGRRAFRVPADAALDHVAGYTCANDLTARDLQTIGGQWIRGKAIDAFLPLGPCLVTPDELPDPGTLPIRCWLNGSVMQDSTTAELVFGVAELIAVLSETITLEPGDVILTGTPGGVGFTREPPVFLQAGDEVTVEIDGIGSLTTRLVPPR